MSILGKSNSCGNRGLRLYMRTFGWPLVTVARDDFAAVKEDN